jgi:hypothetical protein
MLGRIYSIALSAITAEAIVNGFGQLAFLNAVVFFASTGALLTAVAGVLISTWFVPSKIDFWLR